MATRAEAFAVQAASDRAAYDVLCASPLPMCHRLHYLQMWLEKLCKAYLWLPDGTEELRMRHNVVAKVLPRMISEHWDRIGFSQRPNLAEIRNLCREIDLLHPQIDDDGCRPDNVEYPWFSTNGDVVAPAAPKVPFRLAKRLHSHTGRLLLKAAIALTQNPTIFV